MDKAQMLKTIYAKVADKTVSAGCLIKRDDIVCNVIGGYPISLDNGKLYYNCDFGGAATEYTYTIIGHPVLLGDVLDWGYKNSDNYLDRFCYEDFVMEIVNRREETRLPIDQQSDECIKYVYDLVCNA